MTRVCRRGLLAASMVLGLIAGAMPASADTIEVVDEGGYKASFERPVTRIVALNRYNAEFVRAVSGSPTLVGLDRDAWNDRDYWPEIEQGRVIAANQGEIDYEAVVKQKPDLVIIPRNGAWQDARAKLEPFKIPVLVLTGWDVLKHEENVALLGRITGATEQAGKLNAFYRRNMDLIAARVAGIPSRSVYFEADRENITVLKGSGWHDMIATAGGRSLFGEIDVASLPASNRNVNIFAVEPETIAKANPQLVLRLTPPVLAAVPEEKARAQIAALKARPALAGSDAVRDRQVYLMSYYVAGGTSKMTGALQLAKWLHPDRFADVDADAVMREWIEVWQGGKYPGGHVYADRP